MRPVNGVKFADAGNSVSVSTLFTMRVRTAAARVTSSEVATCPPETITRQFHPRRIFTPNSAICVLPSKCGAKCGALP
jgi:hypothetical protein